jgi:transposase, IS30 family
MQKKRKKKKRGGNPLSLKERSIIEVRWCQDRKTVTEIAATLGRNKSSVSRELKGKPRKGRGRYDAERAHRDALARIGRRGNVSKVAMNTRLREYIENKMATEHWSPEQISIRLPHEYTNDETMRISHEAVYQEVYRRVRRGGNGAVKKGCEDLRPYLPRRHKRRAKKGFRQAQRAERPVLPSIEDRPISVERRVQIGHWEDDTMVSRQSIGRFKTINERVTGLVLIGKMRDGSIVESNRVVCGRLRDIPSKYRRTLTRDRGTENFGYREIEKALTLSCYFAHAYCSQERGSNENLNGLIRRFFPKKTDLAKVTDAQVHHVEYLLNTRPRKRHGGKTPLEVLFERTGVAIYS